jgi:hypothetical protein
MPQQRQPEYRLQADRQGWAWSKVTRSHVRKVAHISANRYQIVNLKIRHFMRAAITVTSPVGTINRNEKSSFWVFDFSKGHKRYDKAS